MIRLPVSALAAVLLVSCSSSDRVLRPNDPNATTPTEADPEGSGSSDRDEAQTDPGQKDGTDSSGNLPGQPSTGNDPGTPGTPPGPTTPPTNELAKGLIVSEVAIFQGVKISIAKGGKTVATRNAPIIANRPGLVRVYVTPESSWTAHSVVGELKITDGTKEIALLRETKTIDKASTEDVVASTFNFFIDANVLPVTASYSVAIRETNARAGVTGTTAEYPAAGKSEAFGARGSGRALRVRIVPIQYNADGSGRVPDTTAARIEELRRAMLAVYPTSQVEFTVGAPFATNVAVSANGDGWDALLDAFRNLRQREQPAADIYYYGLFLPRATMAAYCPTSCAAGLSPLATNATDATARASIGLGYAGQFNANTAHTMVHEIAHAHGRPHAPCGGPSGVDTNYPYAGAGLGVWGYDINTRQLFPPTTRDMMSYCNPSFISDYNYRLLFERLRVVNAAGTALESLEGPLQYSVVRVDGNGNLRVTGRTFETWSRPSTAPQEVTYLDANGQRVATATAYYYEYSHLPGGFYLVPKAPASGVKVQFSQPARGLVRELNLAN